MKFSFHVQDGEFVEEAVWAAHRRLPERRDVPGIEHLTIQRTCDPRTAENCGSQCLIAWAAVAVEPEPEQFDGRHSPILMVRAVSPSPVSLAPGDATG